MSLPRWVAVSLFVAACSGDEAPVTLILEGEQTIKVENLGPVEGPAVALSDGRAADGLELQATPESVARIEDGQVVALDRGTATISATWEGQTVRWTLEVSPSMRVAIVEPPAGVKIGEHIQLQAQGVQGGQPVSLEQISWASSDPAIATVDNGQVHGVAAGLVYISASAHGGKAMVELTVE